MFPSQLFESITMALVVGFCFWYIFKCKKNIAGSVYPVTAAVYSVTRFCWEFMRYYPNDELRHVMLGLSFWQFWCVMVIIISAIWILLLKSVKVKELDVKYYAFTDGKYKTFTDKWKNSNTETTRI